MVIRAKMWEEKGRKTSFMFLICVVALLSIQTSLAQATLPTPAAGVLTAGPFVPAGPAKIAGGNTILTGTFTDTLTGTFTGTAVGDARIVLHQNSLNVHIVFEFTGWVNGKSGTMIINFIGNGEGFGLPVRGQWVVQNGAGGLADIHGQGTFEGIAGVSVNYLGQIHFDPI